MSVALLDVSLLIALFNPDHTFHDPAHDWFADRGHKGWATCPVTENGLLRVLGNPNNRSNFVPVPDLADRLRRFCSAEGYQFWSAPVSLLDAELFDLDQVRGYRQLTDIYLLGLAVRRGGRLATFDQRISLAAVKGARREHLELIAPTA
jgi:toxin-antitoxin system PIN domain toxin